MVNFTIQMEDIIRVKVVKGFLLGLSSLQLFLSLSLFGIAFTLNTTILNPDYMTSELDEMDISSLAEEYLHEHITEAIPEGLDFITTETINNIMDDAEPWIREQVDTVILKSCDYLLGKSDSLNLTISTEPLVTILKANLWEALLESPPPLVAGLPSDILETQFNILFQEFSEEIPSTLELAKSMIPPEVIEQLELAREYLHYFQIGYKALIAFIALMIIAIILLYHEVIGTTRSLGITFLTYGVLEYGGILATKHLALPQLPLYGIPPSLQPWISQFISGLLHPLEMLSIGFMAGGVVLLIVSFVYKPRQSEL